MPDRRPIRILIVDDQQSVCDLCAAIGQGMGLVCWQADSAEQALQRVESDLPDVILADMVMGKMSGLELLAEVKKRSPFTEVALMSAYATIENAVEAMRLGAYDFVVKPSPVEKFTFMLERMVEKVRLVRENQSMRDRLQSKAQSGDAPPLLCTDLEELERLTVRQVFEQVGGDKELAQKLLGISRATLYRKIKRYGIKTQQTRQKVPRPGVREPEERMILLSQS
jgi:DNA-binding NtrC family response regulator